MSVLGGERVDPIAQARKTSLARLLGDVDASRAAAHAKHSASSIEMLTASDPRWLAILVEEIGECANALTYDGSRQIRAELMDVLAVASAWVGAIDKTEALEMAQIRGEHFASCAAVVQEGHECECDTERVVRDRLVEIFLQVKTTVLNADFEQGFNRCRKEMLALARGNRVNLDIVATEASPPIDIGGQGSDGAVAV